MGELKRAIVDLEARLSKEEAAKYEVVYGLYAEWLLKEKASDSRYSLVSVSELGVNWTPFAEKGTATSKT